MIKITLDSDKGQSLSVSGTSENIAVDLVSIAASLEAQNPVTLHLVRTAIGLVDSMRDETPARDLASQLSTAIEELEVLANERE